MYINILNKESVEKGMKAISENLLEKIEDITNDVNDVGSITIYAEIKPRRDMQF